MKILAVGVMLGALLGCARDTGNADTAGATTTAVAAPADSATAAAAISNAVAANPSAADSILRANGHTPESFERLLYEIAADSAMSARYVAAKGPSS